MPENKKDALSDAASLELFNKEANGCTVTRRNGAVKEYCPECKLKIGNILPLMCVVEFQCEGVELKIRYCPTCRYEERAGKLPETPAKKS